MTPPVPADILLVDDSAQNLVALRAILDGLGERLVTATSGHDALRAILRQDFAVLLLDVNMPLLDGFETAALIRSRERSRHTPIIFLTAYGEEEHLARGYELGAVDFIRTPVVPDVLRAKVSVFVELHRKSEEVRRQADFLRRRGEQLHRLADAALSISAATSVDAVLAELTARACEILAVRGARARVTLGVRRRHDGAAGAEPLDARTPMPAAELVAEDGAAIGSLLVWEPAEGAFNAEDQAVLSQLARMASVAVQNLVLGEERQANAIKDEFLATVSHELRTPLAAILTWTRLLRDAKLDATALARGVDVIDRNARSQARLIDDLLDMSRVMTGKLELRLLPVDVHGVITASVESANPAAQTRRLTLVPPAAQTGLLVLADADRLQQVLLNLLENAMKFTPDGGRIEVVLVAHVEQVEIQVRDNGRGIDPGFLPHIFDRFRQADSSSTRAHRGLGLGLAIVRQLVELHGGTVHADSPGPDQGATFSVRIPRAPDGVLADRRGATGAGGAPTRLDGVRVLLVEDERDSREALALLVTSAGAQVRPVDSVRAARAVLAEWQPDVVVSDIGLPEEDGYALLPALRALEQASGRLIPAIALTAYVRSQDHARSVASGFLRHLQKPVDASELVNAIAELGPGARPLQVPATLEQG